MTEIELALRDDHFDPTTSERAFRIAATDDAIEIIVTPLIERLRIAAPRHHHRYRRRRRGRRRKSPACHIPHDERSIISTELRAKP
jgi:hypothetical protein